MSAGTGLPGLSLQRIRERRSRCLFHWRGDDGALTDLLGRAGALTRASGHGAGLDRQGRLYRPIHSQPAWDMGDSDGDGVGDSLGILLEGGLSNVLSNPEDLSNAAWSKTNATISSLAVPGPLVDQTTTQTVTETAVSGQHNVSESPTITAGEWIALSAIVAPFGRSRCRLSVNNGADLGQAIFRLDLGTVTTATGGNGQIRGTVFRPLGNGYYEIGIAVRANAGSTAVVCQLDLVNSSDAVSYLGVVGTGMIVTAFQALRCGTTGPTFQRYVGGAGAGPFTRSGDVLSFAGAASILVQDLTVYAKLIRPAWADWTGSLRNIPHILRLGNTGATCDLYFDQATRAFGFTGKDGTNSTSAFANIPSGRVLEVVGQLRNWRTGGSVAIDVGSGLSAFSSALPLPVSAIGSADLYVGGAGTAGFELDGTLLAAKVAAGLRTFAEMQSIL